MRDTVFYLPIGTPVMRRVREKLISHGLTVSDTPAKDVTHLLLGVPSLDVDGTMKNGGPMQPLLEALPPVITLVGGNLDHPLTESYQKIDLLKKESYLWENAAITADCAITIAREKMHRCWKGCRVLILGFGRIGFHLTLTLHSLGAELTVAARKESALAQAESIGAKPVFIDEVDPSPYDVIFNTVPAMVLPDERCGRCAPSCIKMDLASCPGIGGSGVIWARGLPGKYASESSAELIVKTILREVGI